MNEPYPFVFDSFAVHENRSELLFTYVSFVAGKERVFHEKIVLPQSIPADVPEDLMTSFLQNLHLILGISYWKLTCSPKIVIKPFSLNGEQAEFWNILYTKGLGEFFYRNDLDFQGLVNFPSSGDASASAVTWPVEEKSLVGIAGGKDSLVTARLMEGKGFSYTGVVFETGTSYPVIDSIVPFIKAPVIRITREIDEQLFELNKQGVYNGHIPISAVYAFLGMAAASFYGYRYFVVSNEKSANYGNVMYKGMEINHQWSKSMEFEGLFQEYIKKFITTGTTYISLLRPFNELQIMKRFIQHPDLYPHFSSCNRNFKVHGEIQSRKWCGICPKCAFVFALLAAFLPASQVVSIFGVNMFDNSNLLQPYRQLLGTADFKPFECVGTPDEVRAAFLLAQDRREFEGSKVMDMFNREVLPEIQDKEALLQEVMKEGDISILPEKFQILF